MSSDRVKYCSISAMYLFLLAEEKSVKTFCYLLILKPPAVVGILPQTLPIRQIMTIRGASLCPLLAGC